VRYKVKCVSKPDGEGRRKCLGCGKNEHMCGDPDCGLGIVHVGEPTDFTRRSKNKDAKRRQHKQREQEPRRKGKKERPDED